MITSNLLDGWLTTDEAADRMDTSRRAVLHMIRFGRLPAQKVGRVWFVHPSDLPKEWPPEKRDSVEV